MKKLLLRIILVCAGLLFLYIGIFEVVFHAGYFLSETTASGLLGLLLCMGCVALGGYLIYKGVNKTTFAQ